MEDMKREPSEDGPMIGMPSPYPYGLCICLDTQSLEKLGLDGDCAVGDELEFKARAKVKHASHTDNNGTVSHRIELQITHMEVTEHEDAETEEEEGAEEGDGTDEHEPGYRNPYEPRKK